LGADGSNGEIDCIHLVYVALDAMGIETPTFDQGWYDGSPFDVMRDLLGWGERIKGPAYTGDVVVFNQEGWVFGVVWRDGILHISSGTERVSWCAVDLVKSRARFYRSRQSYATCSD
jgi:hypothetical protein